MKTYVVLGFTEELALVVGLLTDGLLDKPEAANELLTDGFAVAVVVGFAPGAIDALGLTGVVVLPSVGLVVVGRVLVDEAKFDFRSGIVLEVDLGAKLVRPAIEDVEPVMRLEMPLAEAFFSSPEV